MPKQYEEIKKKKGKKKAAEIYVGLGKTKKERSQRAKRLQKDRKKKH